MITIRMTRWTRYTCYTRCTGYTGYASGSCGSCGSRGTRWTIITAQVHRVSDWVNKRSTDVSDRSNHDITCQAVV